MVAEIRWTHLGRGHFGTQQHRNANLSQCLKKAYNVVEKYINSTWPQTDILPHYYYWLGSKILLFTLL